MSQSATVLCAYTAEHMRTHYPRRCLALFGRKSTRRGSWAEALMLIFAAALFLFALGLPLAALADAGSEDKLLEAYERGEIVRLHILADGDDAESQRVKLAVRDAVIEKFGAVLARAGAESADAAFGAVTQNLDGIRLAALECARREGFCGEVGAEAGLLILPEKRYGNVLLPEGEYRGLRITLGSGEGKNWWCVLFPQICLELAEENETSEQQPDVVWDSMRILRLWTAFGI